MTPGNTPLRAIRVPDELWAKVQKKAAQEGTSASEVIRKLLTEWVGEK